MAFPPQYREPAPALPSIIVPTSGDRFRSHASHHHELPFSGSPAMSIPGMPPRDDVPPPLPPPRYPGFDQPSALAESMREKREYAHGSFASGYGSMNSSYHEDRPSYQRRSNTGVFGERDEGYASYSSTDRSRESAPSGFGRLHNHFQFQSPADIHGDTLKKKLDQTRPLEKSPPRSLLSSSANELLSRRPSAEGRFPPALSVPVQVQLPIHSRGILGSPARLTDTPIHSAISPRSTPFYHGDRSPNDSSDIDRSPRTRTKRNNSDDATSTNSYDFTGAEDMEMEDGQSLKRLHIDDAYMPGGQKRRAASPNDEHMLGMPDMSRRRDMSSRGSPQGRFNSLSRGVTMPSVSTSRSNSYISNMSMSMHPAGLATANSFGRRSPVGPSPGGISPTSCNSPYTAPVSLNPSPRTSISGRGSIHSRTVSGASTRKITEVQKPGGTKVQGFFMCECCPKKPKRFETIEELNAHEAEKQYECSFCGNRFKNKNEAERHQNSLHVRRHSWSCSALSGYDRAFHDSTNRPGEADTCGYCGDEFPRSGRGPGTGALSGGNAPRHATDQDWDERIRHLQEVHKFRECNSSKKFFRADHFRQHLKHSHAGTSGKWTNMLENACMLEEDPTPR
ncbi:zinc finger protein [Fusarium tjaetaba]|uniref:Zinc finger protein n=1 Tax=Fusarium tjaetaba TaxID=1567544 RepID=A0A8H5RKW4_9HYPO|nr:zinc finger protein [Fusarium tjaetaba]KAF5637375.1 zinc finger protein [Fusarium tjaetaba]